MPEVFPTWKATAYCSQFDMTAEVTATSPANPGASHSLTKTTETTAIWATPTNNNGSLYNIAVHEDVSHKVSVYYFLYLSLITFTCVANILVMLVIIKNK